MKVCHVNLSRHFSGSERQTLQLIKRQLREAYKITVVARHSSPFAQEVAKLPCRLIITRSSLTKQSAKLNTYCSLIQAHEDQGAQWAYMQHKRYDTPYIITRRIDKHVPNKYLLLKTYRKAKALVGVSSQVVKNLHTQFIDKLCIKIPSSPVSYPVNQNKVDQIWSAHAHKTLVLQASYLGPQKGFDTSIEAAKLLEKNNTPVHFLFLGSGPEEENLQKQAAKLSNVFFMGKQDDIGTWFASANMLIHPSRSEGLGSVLLEAMVAGLPTIASNTGGIPDIIEHEQTGLLIETGNAQELASAIKRLIDDQALRKQLQTGAKEKLGEFDINHTTSLYDKLYKQVLSPQQE
tara:strand:+ start:92 stop:1135 length:1044 start_codon:yes stop_codon:yes gene_type:complete